MYRVFHPCLVRARPGCFGRLPISRRCFRRETTRVFELTLTEPVLWALKRTHLMVRTKASATFLAGRMANSPQVFPPYSRPPFNTRPIRCYADRPNGWVRAFSGHLRLEYTTGLIYSGVRLMGHCWDGLYPPDHLPATAPFSVLRARRRWIDEGIVLKTLWGADYYHFLFQFVPKMDMIDQAGIGPDVPVVVTRDLAGQSFFRDACGLGLFGSRPVIIQEPDEAIAARRLYVVRPDSHTDRQLSFARDRFGGRPDPLGRARIYVSRNGQSDTSRQIVNEPDLWELLKERGFSLLDPGTVTLAEQMARFAGASIVVGPHGAGLTNIVFRHGSPMALVEMINDTKIWNHHFYQIALHSGFFYRATLNRSLDTSDQNAPARADIDSVLAVVDETIAWEAAIYAEKTAWQR